MSNDYFKFRHFTVTQDKCAMKVCTDSCILGSWFAGKMTGINAVLDIGSGSGLLMLMLAQKSKAAIHGIEIDQPAYQQSLGNIQTFSANQKLAVFNGDAREFVFPEKYDFIISNPPFYQNDLPGQALNDNVAKHSTVLDFGQLLNIISKNLSANGTFGVLLPARRWKSFDDSVPKEFTGLERVFLRQTPAHEPFRAILHYGRQTMGGVKESELIIKDHSGIYTSEFVRLLKDYYLYL